MPPTQMTTLVNSIVGPPSTSVDCAVLKVGTDGQLNHLQPNMQMLCKYVITLLYHLRGHCFGITPLVQSSKAGFYSSTAKFISESWLGTLPNAQFWLTAHHDLHQPDTWSCQRLTAFTDLHRHFCSELNRMGSTCTTCQRSGPSALHRCSHPPPPQPCLLHCKCYCGKMMTTQHIAQRSHRNATSCVRS